MASNPISTLPAAQTVSWTGRSSIASGADGYLDVKNSAGTGFTGVRLGGATSSFPMLKRSSATLQARLADDSGYAAMATGGLTVNGTATVTPASETQQAFVVRHSDSTPRAMFGTFPGASTYAGFWTGNITPGASNYTILSNGTNETILNTASGSILFRISHASTPTVFTSDTFRIGSGVELSWSDSASAKDGSLDVRLFRDSSGVLAQRNITNAQTLRVYRTWTNSTNYERVALQTGSGYGQLAVESAGTGTANMDLALTPAGTGNLKFGTHSAIGAETVTGYITIKDSGGTTRKLAVVS